ncbi:hypothetical protein APHCRT_0780 [Anaplasma phagocytophilum str. CRT53-1]|uniref:Uncharacterized protein n=4 Tax=Anaplasma phagocytophilum TaxID=948 RepID=Q2GK58_ANAPZ|nr:hypothetical protein APH_0661 [Anaplasma phagocytophilum str. HZ]KJV59653.1 hypothetical protein APHWEB_1366 [Anaplasma phagocytophilum str. Webster]KJV65310.1 hypothetical protein EPHNCH_0962 [Anaplasma phagocytophilum str. NCH-1]KJV82399.1 hypothetical protein APHHGE2_0946 [Anaplasma phagocytophilum str. HGE2]KJV84537.1 hypothetical protein APHWI1_0149 [Anaplasma phagocytophilum str. ApWI1]KJV86060.1 hypothetical protein APHCRT_0780 [Anaplasma phagocytophilum str. CRT53-1]KJV87412.1 hypo
MERREFCYIDVIPRQFSKRYVANRISAGEIIALKGFKYQ